MVDQEQIEQLISKHFTFFGKHSIVNGVVNVKGDVFFTDRELDKIPVQFGIIDGGLVIRDTKIKTLEGCPKLLTGGLIVRSCKNLTSCVGAPNMVKGYVHIRYCPLKSLEGFPPKCAHAIVEYDLELPLLRLLQVPGNVDCYVSDHDPDKEAVANIVVPILNDPRWKGKGKSGALNCALELKKAGYAGNARW